MQWRTSKILCDDRTGVGPTTTRPGTPVVKKTLLTDTAMTKNGRLTELLFYFLRLGLLGFGGPVALVGQMEREVVAERGPLSKEQMREAIAICQSLPGPLAIQVGIYIAYLSGAFWGTWIGGWAFIFPNFVIVAALGGSFALGARRGNARRNRVILCCLAHDDFAHQVAARCPDDPIDRRASKLRREDCRARAGAKAGATSRMNRSISSLTCGCGLRPTLK
jgi:hypothetical protein